MASPRIKLIHWHDSSHYGSVGWVDKDDVEKFGKEKPLTCQSVGFEVSRSETCVVLAESLTKNQAGEILKIPLSAIKWELDITPKQKKRK